MVLFSNLEYYNSTQPVKDTQHNTLTQKLLFIIKWAILTITQHTHATLPQ